MLSKILSFGLNGLAGYPVLVEVDVYNGLPAYETVGLPDAAVKESKERVRSAIKNSGFDYPQKRITVNLAPADLKKEGPVYDLPIAVGLLCATSQISAELLDKIVILGELSLNGDVRSVKGILPMVIEAKNKGYKYIIVPKDNAKEAACVKGMNVIPADCLSKIAAILNKKIKPEIVKYEENIINNDSSDTLVDFSDIKGQEIAKRAAMIACAGGHNILLIGRPGTGKSMIAKAIPGILPDLTFEESLEVTKIHSVAGMLNGGIITKRPFRSPHHTASSVALMGGGAKIMPGEISLAHNGVLFLDELPEFQRDVREAMRQPMEDKIISIARAASKVDFPADFMLVASMNPCPCGFFGSDSGKCKCTPKQISNYLGKISGPFLDRIDLQIEMNDVSYDEISDKKKGMSSREIKAVVNNARMRQIKRYSSLGITNNAGLNSAMIEEYGKFSDSCYPLLKNIYNKLGLSARAYTRIMLVARTIADIEDCEYVESAHIAEAVRYRTLDRKYWGQIND